MTKPTPIRVRRGSADGILRSVAAGGKIQPETLEHLLSLLREKTDYPHHVAVEIQTGALLKTIDNEADAQETIRRLIAAPAKPTKRDQHAFASARNKG